MTHREAEKLMYEYVRAELDPGQEAKVKRHVAECVRCQEALRELRELLLRVPVESVEAPEEDTFWMNLHEKIMQSTAENGNAPGRSLLRMIGDLLPRPALRWSIGTGVALASALVLILWWTSVHRPKGPPVETVAVPVRSGDEAQRYFRQSRSLLVGLTNMDLPSDAAVDLTAEQKLSRELVLQGRTLQLQHMDPGSHRLITDLDRIMEQVSDARGARTQPELELIRREIRQRNLLIKVRMAETTLAGSAMLRNYNSQ